MTKKLAFILFLFCSPQAWSATRSVPSVYADIATAYAAANEGDVIEMAASTSPYVAGNYMDLNRAINITFQSLTAKTTDVIIQSVGGNYVFLTNSAGVTSTFKNMTIDGSGYFRFTVAGWTVQPTADAVYTNNGSTFTVLSADATHVLTRRSGGTADPQVSGDLIKTSGTGDTPATYSAITASGMAEAIISMLNATHNIVITNCVVTNTRASSPTLYTRTNNGNRYLTVNGGSIVTSTAGDAIYSNVSIDTITVAGTGTTIQGGGAFAGINVFAGTLSNLNINTGAIINGGSASSNSLIIQNSGIISTMTMNGATLDKQINIGVNNQGAYSISNCTMKNISIGANMASLSATSNVMTGTTGTGISQSAGKTMTTFYAGYNTIGDGFQNCISFSGITTNFTVEYNTLTINKAAGAGQAIAIGGDDFASDLMGCTNGLIRYNTIAYTGTNFGHALFAGFGSTATITYNIVWTGAGDAALVIKGDWKTITHNRIYGSGGIGIFGGGNNDVEYNTVASLTGANAYPVFQITRNTLPNGASYTTCTFSTTTTSITKVAAFANYTVKVGYDYWYTSASGGSMTLGFYPVLSKTSNDIIVISTNGIPSGAGNTDANVTGVVYRIPGLNTVKHNIFQSSSSGANDVAFSVSPATVAVATTNGSKENYVDHNLYWNTITAKLTNVAGTIFSTNLIGVNAKWISEWGSSLVNNDLTSFVMNPDFLSTDYTNANFLKVHTNLSFRGGAFPSRSFLHIGSRSHGGSGFWHIGGN